VTSSSVTVTGGTINGTTIGASTASTGAFTTLTSNSTTTLNGTTIPVSSTLVTTTATQTITGKTISADDNTLSGIAASSFVLSNGSGNIDGSAAQKAIPSGAVVGTTDTQTLTGKTISADDNTLSGIAASSFVLSNGSGNIDGSAAQKAIPSGAVVGTTDTQTLTGKTLSTGTAITAGTIDGTTIGVTSASTGAFTTLSTTGALTYGGVTLSNSVTGTGSMVLQTSPSLTTPALGTPTAGVLSACTVDGTDSVGFRNAPINSRSADYTLVLADSGKTIFHPASDNNARTFTIPANSSVAYAVGTVVSFINLAAADVTIAITTDTMYLGGDGATGSRTLAEYGIASALKVSSTDWVISGNGLT
jgi:uncharacterized spore protein YtfJ